MTVISAQYAAQTYNCIIPNCTGEASGEDGLCDTCRKAGRFGTAESDVVDFHRGKHLTQFVCATEGCTNTVKTNKGVGAHCVQKQPNGKTHRREWIEQHQKGIDVKDALLLEPMPDDDVIVGKSEPTLTQEIAEATLEVKKAQKALRAKEKNLTKLMKRFLNESEKK